MYFDEILISKNKTQSQIFSNTLTSFRILPKIRVKIRLFSHIFLYKKIEIICFNITVLRMLYTQLWGNHWINNKICIVVNVAAAHFHIWRQSDFYFSLLNIYTRVALIIAKETCERFGHNCLFLLYNIDFHLFKLTWR